MFDQTHPLEIRPDIVNAIETTGLGIIEKPLSLPQRIADHGGVRKSLLLVVLAIIWECYARWLDSRTNWFVPGKNPEPPDSDVTEAVPGSIPLPMPVARKSVKGGPGPQLPAPADAGGRLEIEAVEGGLENILRNLK